MNTQKTHKTLSEIFQKQASVITKLTGSSNAFLIAISTIIIWALCGSIFNFSNTWQLIINISTTIITFLMVFIIQQSQNKDFLAVQIKLNELIACEKRASNRLIMIEDLTQEELEVLRKFYIKLSNLSKQENNLHSSHSVDEANEFHEVKSAHVKSRVSIKKNKTSA